MKKITFVLIVLLATALSSVARERPAVFISATGGANICIENLFGSVEKDESMYGGVQPAFSANFGVWATDCVGFGGGYNGFRLVNSLPSFPVEGINFNYAYATCYWDITNTIHGYRADKVVNFVPYLTAGAVITKEVRFGAGLGISMPISIGRNFAFIPDIQVIGTADTTYGDINIGIYGVIVPSFGIRVSF